MEDSQKIEEQVQEGVISDNGTEKKQETRDEMLSQHSLTIVRGITLVKLKVELVDM
ncbi:uncharacterized protein DS421_15g515870 [Arachis hypogaea]|nr:uncharacterized protein DS421_15g515870 [Arachis hypogaea]